MRKLIWIGIGALILAWLLLAAIPAIMMAFQGGHV